MVVEGSVKRDESSCSNGGSVGQDNVESMKLRSSSFYIIYYLGRVREGRIRREGNGKRVASLGGRYGSSVYPF